MQITTAAGTNQTHARRLQVTSQTSRYVWGFAICQPFWSLLTTTMHLYRWQPFAMHLSVIFFIYVQGRKIPRGRQSGGQEHRQHKFVCAIRLRSSSPGFHHLLIGTWTVCQQASQSRCDGDLPNLYFHTDGNLPDPCIQTFVARHGPSWGVNMAGKILLKQNRTTP